MSAREAAQTGMAHRLLSVWQARPAWLGGARQPSEDSRAIPIHDWTGRSGQPVRISGFDQPLVLVVLVLVCLGLVMVYSASVALPDNPRFARYAPTHYLFRHLLSIAVATVCAVAVLQIPIRFWERYAPHLFVLALVLLLIVLIPFVGKGVNGARRWIALGGGLNFQPSEWAKLAMAMYAANYMVRKMDARENFVRAVLPMGVALGVVGVLLLAEPDMGAFMVIAAIALGILFLGGVNGRMFLISAAILIAAFVLMIALSEFRRERIFAYLDPWNPDHAQGKAYQLTHSLIAYGRGELFGQGLGNSVEKLYYLPEAFFWLTRRIFAIGRQAIAMDRVFAGLMAQGIGVWIGAQAFINIGVTLGVLPTKGLTLPLMSYGGSALLLNLMAVAIVLRVDIENRQLMRGGRA